MSISKHNKVIGERIRQAILDELAAGPKSARELADEIGASVSAVGDHLRDLRTRGRKVVFVWKLQARARGGQPSQIFALGNRPDAIATTQMPPDDEVEAWMDRRAEKMRGKIGPPPPDPMLAWIPRRSQQHREAA
jgi:predicted ArsR family transcriptional regulator